MCRMFLTSKGKPHPWRRQGQPLCQNDTQRHTHTNRGHQTAPSNDTSRELGEGGSPFFAREIGAREPHKSLLLSGIFL